MQVFRCVFVAKYLLFWLPNLVWCIMHKSNMVKLYIVDIKSGKNI